MTNKKTNKWEMRIGTMVIILCVFVIIFLWVLDFGDVRSPRIDRDCCNDVCEQGNLACHRYTRDYIICKVPENASSNGVSQTISLTVFNTSEACPREAG